MAHSELGRPRSINKGPFSQLLHPKGLALNLKHGEIYIIDNIGNGLFTFLVPEWAAIGPFYRMRSSGQ
jgi:hypothetical protein